MLQSKQKQGKRQKIILCSNRHSNRFKHEDLQGQLWMNSSEIPHNEIDDDHNGYTDDVNGWSFIGDKKGGYVV
jgi:hypothetical protein